MPAAAAGATATAGNCMRNGVHAACWPLQPPVAAAAAVRRLSGSPAAVLELLPEVFEQLIGITWSLEGYWVDTSIDVALDLVGGTAAFFFFNGQYVNGHGV